MERLTYLLLKIENSQTIYPKKGKTQQSGALPLRRSKLESYEAILEAIIRKPLAMERIAYETDMDCNTINRRLGFLMENGLVQERPWPRKAIYAITERGIAVFKTLNFRRYLERISDALSAVDEAMQTLPEISKEHGETEEKSSNEKY